MQRSKVFCLSFQRTGTTSVGKFFRDTGFRWSGWKDCKKNSWSQLWYDGNYEAIFSSHDFINANAFEDSPWFFPDFYKILFYKFETAKFVLLERDLDAWFNSMQNHSNGKVIGQSRIHCKIYRREQEFYELLDAKLISDVSESRIKTRKMLIDDNRSKKYKEIYSIHNREVKEFFERVNPNSLFVGKLEDPMKWQKLAEFLHVSVPPDYEVKENQSDERMKILKYMSSPRRL